MYLRNNGMNIMSFYVFNSSKCKGRKDTGTYQPRISGIDRFIASKRTVRQDELAGIEQADEYLAYFFPR